MDILSIQIPIQKLIQEMAVLNNNLKPIPGDEKGSNSFKRKLKSYSER